MWPPHYFVEKHRYENLELWRVFPPPPPWLLLMNILNKTQLLPGICKSLKTTVIRQHELCA